MSIPIKIMFDIDAPRCISDRCITKPCPWQMDCKQYIALTKEEYAQLTAERTLREELERLRGRNENLEERIKRDHAAFEKLVSLANGQANEAQAEAKRYRDALEAIRKEGREFYYNVGSSFGQLAANMAEKALNAGKEDGR
jgi:formiminotetrahydrofolate cyclodeaminase